MNVPREWDTAFHFATAPHRIASSRPVSKIGGNGLNELLAGASELRTPEAIRHFPIVYMLAYSALALGGCRFAYAGEGLTPELSTVQSAPLLLPDALKQIAAFGGLRSSVEDAGVKFTFTYYGDAMGNPSGGVQQGAGYSGRFGTIIDGDLQKLMGWSGATFHASIHEIFGHGLSANNVDNLMLVSSIEAPNSTRLFNLWIEQKLDNHASLLVGQYTAAQEFLVSKSANLFVNSTFGWPVVTAQDLPSGGPAYPIGALGARILYRPNDQIVVRAAVFDGNPAGPGTGDPVTRDPHGLAFRLGDPAFMIAEMVFRYHQNHPDSPQINIQQEGERAGESDRSSMDPSSDRSLPGSVKFGAWYIAGSFADPRFNAQGGLLAGSGGPPLQHAGNFSAYGVLDQMIWRAAPGGDRGLNFFLRATAAPSDRNLIDLYVDTGLAFKGLFDSRPNDSLGLAFAYSRVSSQVASYDQDLAAVTKIATPIRDFEAVFELTYQYQVAKNWTLQPDVQYIVHPGANMADPRGPTGTAPIANAVVVGLRTILKF